MATTIKYYIADYSPKFHLNIRENWYERRQVLSINE